MRQTCDIAEVKKLQNMYLVLMTDNCFAVRTRSAVHEEASEDTFLHNFIIPASLHAKMKAQITLAKQNSDLLEKNARNLPDPKQWIAQWFGNRTPRFNVLSYLTQCLSWTMMILICVLPFACRVSLRRNDEFFRIQSMCRRYKSDMRWVKNACFVSNEMKSIMSFEPEVQCKLVIHI